MNTSGFHLTYEYKDYFIKNKLSLLMMTAVAFAGIGSVLFHIYNRSLLRLLFTFLNSFGTYVFKN